jgi:hypothetical protein
MNLPHRWTTFTARFDLTKEVLSHRANILTFLLIRLLLMSAMVVGFSRYAFDLHP